MSSQTIINQISNLQRDIQSYQKQLAKTSKEIANNSKRISQIKRSITKTTSSSTYQSKQREIQRLEDNISRNQEKQASLNKRVSDKTSRLYKYEQQLRDEQEREQKRLLDTLKKNEREDRKRQDELLQRIHMQQISNLTLGDIPFNQSYDAFISHASEDKDSFVRPLAHALQDMGFSIWYDEFQLKVGDSLRRSIDKGLIQSRYGIVVLSPDFFAKDWPQYELDGLVAKEMTKGKVILPIWHKVSKDEVLSYSPSLADKIALSTSMNTIEELAHKLNEILKLGKLD